MKMQAGLELLVTIFVVFILVTIKNLAGLPLWKKYIYDVIEIIDILVAPGKSWNGIVRAISKNKKHLVKVNFLLARGRRVFLAALRC